jgi:anthranilate phosphoribosyltransferase
LVPYREQIGKRPPFATAELMWSPYRGAQRRVVGYVHPPTAALAQQTFALLGVDDFVTVKGLEGSVDLPCDRTAIIGIHSAQSGPSQHLIHARDYGLGGPEVPWTDIETWSQGILATLQGEPTAWQPACLWNGGFYLWQAGICDSLTAGLSTAKALLSSGELLKTLNCLAEKTRQPISVLD